MSPPNNSQNFARDNYPSVSPQNSSAPLLRNTEFDTTSTIEHHSLADRTTGPATINSGRLFGKDDITDGMDARMDASSDSQFMPSTQAAVAAMRPTSPPRASGQAHSTSPGPNAVTTHRPIMSSSQQPSLDPSTIFERDVQDSSIPDELSSAIPSHIQTEDHIPAVLEASSLAITDTRLDPDHVEIVTHAAHQPAAEKVAESAPALHSDINLPTSAHGSHHESFPSATSHHDGEENTSSYGTLDPNDVRRLSFISFADVVHAEHVDATGKELLHHLPLSSSPLARAQSPPTARSPSPVRSPLSANSQTFSRELTTPPLGSNSASVKGLDMSPSRSPPPGPQQHGELTIETMRQALRKTGSGDLRAAARERSLSQPASAIGTEDAGTDRHTFR